MGPRPQRDRRAHRDGEAGHRHGEGRAGAYGVMEKLAELDKRLVFRADHLAVVRSLPQRR